jgi:uncharacterized protein
MSIKKLIRVLHRDLGYFFAGLVIVYSISGIALNHNHQWNPNYIITKSEFNAILPADSSQITLETIKEILHQHDEKDVMSFYYPKNDQIKAFVKNGTATISLNDGKVVVEKIRKRPFFSQVNYLHYNAARKWWTVFSDIFAISLVVITITGLFLVKGKNGITRRGAILGIIGLLFPILVLLLSNS